MHVTSEGLCLCHALRLWRHTRTDQKSLAKTPRKIRLIPYLYVHNIETDLSLWSCTVKQVLAPWECLHGFSKGT